MNEFNLVGKVMSLSQNEKGCEIKLEVFREVRLWITTIVVPLAITTTLIISNQKFKKKISELKNKIKKSSKKKEDYSFLD